MGFFKRIFGREDISERRFKSDPITKYYDGSFLDTGTTHLVVMFTYPGPKKITDALLKQVVFNISNEHLAEYETPNEHGFVPSSECLIHSITYVTDYKTNYSMIQKIAIKHDILTPQYLIQNLAYTEVGTHGVQVMWLQDMPKISGFNV